MESRLQPVQLPGAEASTGQVPGVATSAGPNYLGWSLHPAQLLGVEASAGATAWSEGFIRRNRLEWRLQPDPTAWSGGFSRRNCLEPRLQPARLLGVEASAGPNCLESRLQPAPISLQTGQSPSQAVIRLRTIRTRGLQSHSWQPWYTTTKSSAARCGSSSSCIHRAMTAWCPAPLPPCLFADRE